MWRHYRDFGVAGQSTEFGNLGWQNSPYPPSYRYMRHHPPYAW